MNRPTFAWFSIAVSGLGPWPLTFGYLHPFIQQLFIVHLTWALCGGDANVDVFVYSRM